MSYFEANLIPTLVLGEFVGTGITYVLLKVWQRRNLGDPHKEKREWEEKMKKVATDAAIQCVEDLKLYFESEAKKAAAEAPTDIKIDTAPMEARITAVIDQKLESLKMSELGKMSGLVRSTQAAQVALVSESNPRMMGILTGLGLSKKESAAIMMAISEAGGVPGLPGVGNTNIQGGLRVDAGSNKLA